MRRDIAIGHDMVEYLRAQMKRRDRIWNKFASQAFDVIGRSIWRVTMKRYVLIGATAMTVVFAGSVLAQSVAIEIAPEQRTRIKEYVVKEKVKPVTVKERISVGATLPADVELRAVPSDWGPTVSKYRYVYSDNHVYFVDPSSRRVVTTID
jgi:hypothetical protein